MFNKKNKNEDYIKKLSEYLKNVYDKDLIHVEVNERIDDIQIIYHLKSHNNTQFYNNELLLTEEELIHSKKMYKYIEKNIDEYIVEVHKNNIKII